MKNTYLNDGNLSPYPFMSDTVLPFAYSTIAGFGAFVTGNVTGLKVTSVEISEKRVHVVISDQSGQPAGSVSATEGGSGTFSYSGHGITVTGFLQAGVVHDSNYGTYATDLWIDPACIVKYSADDNGHDTVLVNGVGYTPGETLELLFGTLLNVDTSDPSDVRITGDVPEGVATNIQDAVYDYSMVTGIAGAPLSTNPGISGGTLTIATAPPADEPSANPDDYITVTARAVGTDMVMVNVHGTHKFHNCYGNNDEADNVNATDI